MSYVMFYTSNFVGKNWANDVHNLAHSAAGRGVLVSVSLWSN